MYLGIGWWFCRVFFVEMNYWYYKERGVYMCYSHLSICKLDRSSKNLMVDICMVSQMSRSPENITHPVNQPLFATTIFSNLTNMNWFAATNFCDQALSTSISLLQLYNKYWSAAGNIRNNEALVDLTQISRAWINVGIQYHIGRK